MVKKSEQAIGIFDSGVGGTSIWKEIHALLPHENTIYLADSKNAPYGVKSREKIISLCVKNTELLLTKGCKIIVVACNTATTNAILYLRENYDIPFIGIEPAIKPASINTQTKRVGILATKGTLSSELFQETASLYSNGIKLIEQDGTGIVELIESGKIYSKKMKGLLEKYLNPLIRENIDFLVLGCSHYPYLTPILKEILPPKIKIIDSGYAVARQTKSILEKHSLLNLNDRKPNLKFYSNSDIVVLSSLLDHTCEVEKLDF